MPSDFRIAEVVTERGPVVLRVFGQLDAKSTPGLVEHCKSLRTRGKNVVLNLSQVSFIASSGIGGILSLIEDFKTEELSVRLADLSTAVDSVIKLLNLNEFLDIDGTEGAALEAMES